MIVTRLYFIIQTLSLKEEIVIKKYSEILSCTIFAEKYYDQLLFSYKNNPIKYVETNPNQLLMKIFSKLTILFNSHRLALQIIKKSTFIMCCSLSPTLRKESGHARNLWYVLNGLGRATL